MRPNVVPKPSCISSFDPHVYTSPCCKRENPRLERELHGHADMRAEIPAQ